MHFPENVVIGKPDEDVIGEWLETIPAFLREGHEKSKVTLELILKHFNPSEIPRFENLITIEICKGHKNSGTDDFYLLIPEKHKADAIFSKPLNTHIKIKGFKIAAKVSSANLAWLCNSGSGKKILAVTMTRSKNYVNIWKELNASDVAIWAALHLDIYEEGKKKFQNSKED